MSARSQSDRLASSTSSSSLYGSGMPINKRLQPCGPPSPGLPHRSVYLQAPPGRDQPPAVARYGLQMASVPASYDAAAAVAAAAFHAQSYPPKPGDEQRYRGGSGVAPSQHRLSLLGSFHTTESLSREAMRAAYVTPSSSTSLAHGSSGPMSLQLPMYRSQHQPPEPAPVTGLLGGQQPTSNLSAPVYGVPVPVGYKRPAMLSSEYGLSSGRRALLEPLKIDTELKKETSGAYNPQVEAISPTLPNDEARDVIKQSKEELLQNINRADREIGIVEQNLKKLQTKQHQLEKEVKKSPEERIATPDQLLDLRHQSIAQIIYEDNRRKSAESCAALNKLGKPTVLPLYYQPCDTSSCQETVKKFVGFKKQLVALLKKRQQATQIRERYLCARYDQLIQLWTKKMERLENSSKKRAKDAKMRECFEKMFPELKKQREDKERLPGRISGCANRVPGYACSEAIVEQIVDGFHEQEEEEKKRYSLAVIPPMMLDSHRRSLRYHNENGLILDPQAENKEAMLRVQYWSPAENETFKERYLAHPKNFGYIANALDNKTVQDCVLYYYLSKMSANYKQMVRRHLSKRRTKLQKKMAADVEDASNEKPLPGSEYVSPVSSATNYPDSMAAAGDASLPATDGAEDTASDIGAEPATSQLEIDAETETTPTDSKIGGDSDEQPVSDQQGDVDESHDCAVCGVRVEHPGLSRPLTESNCSLYDIGESQLTDDMRVCNSCRCKSIHKRYMQCQMPTCKVSRRKTRHLRQLPAKLNDLPAETRSDIMNKLQLTSDAVRCCSSCFNRVVRMINGVQSGDSVECSDDAAELSIWTNDEVELIKQGLQELGKNWAEVAGCVGSKTAAQCKRFYRTQRQKLDLDDLIASEGDVDVSLGEQMSKAAASEDEEVLSDEDDIESEDENMDLAITTDVSDKDIESKLTDADSELKTKTVAAETVVTSKSQVNENPIPSEADNSDTKPPVKISPSASTVSTNDTQSLTTAGTSDDQSCEVGPQPTNGDCLASQPNNSEDSQETTGKSEEKSDGCSMSCVRDIINTAIEKTLQDTDDQRRSQTPPPAVNACDWTERAKTQQSVKQETERLLYDRQRSESANPAVHYRDARLADDVAEDLSRPLSSSYPHYHRPSAHIGVAGAPSARLHDELTLQMKLPPPAHSHHRRTDAAADHILTDNSMQHRSPARNMPSPRGYVGGDHLQSDMLPRDEVQRPVRRNVPPPLPCLPPRQCTVTSAGGTVLKFSAAASGPPPLIHEPVKGVSGGGSIVLGTPLSPEQRRRHFELPPAVGMLYKGGNDPTMLRSSFPAAMVSQPPQDGQFPIITRQTGVPWPPSPVQQSVIRAAVDANVATSSRDLLYGDLMTARQMHRTQVAGMTDASADRRRISPRSAGSCAPPAWHHAPRSGRIDPTGHQYFDDVHRADILSTMLPWPVRPQANVARYSVCGEPSRQCYTPPLPIHKAVVGRDAVPVSDRPTHRDNLNAFVPSQFPDPSCGGPKISPKYKDTAENIAEWRRIHSRHSPTANTREVLSGGGHMPDNQGNVQVSAVTTQSEQLTAAGLIEAIIYKEINQDTSMVTPVTEKPVGHSAGRAGSISILDRLRTDTSTTDQSAAASLAPVPCSPTAAEKQQQSVKLPPGDTAHSGRTLSDHINSIIMHDFKQKDEDVADGSMFDTSTNIGNDSMQQALTETADDSVDDQTDERDSELGTKSSVEVCSSLGCLSPLASTDALLPSFQPDDEAGVKSPQPSVVAELPQRNYPGSVPQFAARRNKSPRSDELYSTGPGHTSSYSGHSPRPEVSPTALRRSPYCEQVTRNSPRSSEAAVDDLTSQSKVDWAFVETRRDQQNQSQNIGDGNFGREIVNSNMGLLRVDTSPRQSRDPTTNHLSEHRGLAISRGHSSTESSVCDTERIRVTGMDSQWLELSRKRTASGSCLSPHSSKSASPSTRSGSANVVWLSSSLSPRSYLPPSSPRNIDFQLQHTAASSQPSGRTEMSGIDVVRSQASDTVEGSHLSCPPQSRLTDSVQGQVVVSRQRENTVPSSSTLTPSPKRRRLEAMDAHQSETECNLRPPGDQQSTAVLPVILLNEEFEPLPTTLANSAAPREGPPDSSEDLDKPSSSPDVVEKVADLLARPAADCCPKNEEKTSPVDRQLSTEDS